MSNLFLEPISLGYSCDVKYHLSRSLYFRWHPDHDETQFRNMLFRWLRQETRFRRHIFDWMICPLPAVCEYLERDFQGVFEREDLEIIDQGRKVRHRRLLTIHPHDFRPGPDGLYTEASVDAQYPDARAKFDYLAERFRRHLTTPGPYLYVFKQIRPVDEVERLRDLLAARSPGHLFQLLLVDYRGQVNQVLNRMRGQAVKGWLSGGSDKPADRRWEGDDADWDRILDRFDLGLHEDGGTVHSGPAPWANLPPPKPFDLSAPPANGWRVLTEAQGGHAFLDLFPFTDPLDPTTLPRREGDAVMIDNPSAEAHFFCHMQPVSVMADGAWARVTLAWPPGTPDAERMTGLLQDQGCRHIILRPEARGDGIVAWARLPWDVDDLRLVFLPAPGPHSVAPILARIEVCGPDALPEGETGQAGRSAPIPADYVVPAAPGRATMTPSRSGLGGLLRRLAGISPAKR